MSKEGPACFQFRKKSERTSSSAKRLEIESLEKRNL